MSAAPIYREHRPTPSARTPQRNRRPVKKSSPFSKVLVRMVAHALVFLAVCGVTMGFSSLVGHSMKENARREAIRASQRAKVARVDAGRIRARFERLTTLKAVDAWTKVNGFVPGYQFQKKAVAPEVPTRTNLVARRDVGLKVDVLVSKG